MSWIVVDVEADGPYPGEYSMVSFGAVVVDEKLDRTFYGKTKPIAGNFIPDALAVSGFSRLDHLGFDEPASVMQDFATWIKDVSAGRPVFVSDNPAFDWQWINHYFHRFYGLNPFGWSARRIGDMYAGLVKDPYAGWKHLRKTKHTHNPVDDARGNAEALLAMREMGLKCPTK